MTPTVTISRELAEEIIHSHSCPESGDYQKCDIEPCGWCEKLRAALDAPAGSGDDLSTTEGITDSDRLDWLDAQRRHYSRPPMRAVTGWHWQVINEGGIETIREAIDAAIKQEKGRLAIS